MNIPNNESIKNNITEEYSPIKDFYRDKVIFLTGTTGVLGELYLEKLLRCNVRKVYILLRPKKDLTETARLKKLFATKIYHRLEKIDPNYFERISIICGNLTDLKIGISSNDVNELIQNVEIILHGAADVRFDSPLLDICCSNLRGTNELLQLAKKFKKLISFIYVSTAYCHSHKFNSYTKETFYKPPIVVDEMLKLCSFNEKTHQLDENNLLTILTSKFIGVWPNTYTFSKAITESLIQKESIHLPITVIRPTIVIATHEDPLPGYCSNYFGLNGVLAASAGGLTRIIFGSKENRANIVCADFVTNSTLAIIHYEHKNRQINQSKFEEARIYTINNLTENLNWGLISDTMIDHYSKFPWMSSIWAPKMNFSGNLLIQHYMIIVYQFIPGIIFDILLMATKSTKRVLPIYRKIVMFISVISYFMANQWKFESENIKKVYTQMSDNDRINFPIGVEHFNWNKYVDAYGLGLREYVAKEKFETVEQAKRRFNIIRTAHAICLIIYYSILAYFWYLLFRYFRIVN